MKDGDTEVWMDDGPVTKAAKPSEVQIDPAPDQLPVKEIKPNRPDKVTQFLDSLEHGAGD